MKVDANCLELKYVQNMGNDIYIQYFKCREGKEEKKKWRTSPPLGVASQDFVNSLDFSSFLLHDDDDADIFRFIPDILGRSDLTS